MTEPTPQSEGEFVQEQTPADDQPTMRLHQPDPDATRPMSLADLLNSD